MYSELHLAQSVIAMWYSGNRDATIMVYWDDEPTFQNVSEHHLSLNDIPEWFPCGFFSLSAVMHAIF